MSKSQAKRRATRRLAFEPIESRLLLTGNSPALNTDIYNPDTLFDYAQFSNDVDSSAASYAANGAKDNHVSLPGGFVFSAGGVDGKLGSTIHLGSDLSQSGWDWTIFPGVNSAPVGSEITAGVAGNQNLSLNISGSLLQYRSAELGGSLGDSVLRDDLVSLYGRLQTHFQGLSLDGAAPTEFVLLSEARPTVTGSDTYFQASNFQSSGLNDLLAVRGNLLISVRPTIGGGVELSVSVASTDENAASIAGTPAPTTEQPAAALETGNSAAAGEGGMIAVNRVIAELRSERAAVQVARSSIAGPQVTEVAAAGVSGELARAVAFERIEGASDDAAATSPIALLLSESSSRSLVAAATKAAVSDAVYRPELEHDAAGQIRLAAFVNAGVAGLGGGSLGVPMESIAAEWADDGSPVRAEATSDEVRREIFAGWENADAAPSRLADLKHRALSWDSMGVVTALACGHVATRSRKRRARDAALVRGNREV